MGLRKVYYRALYKGIVVMCESWCKLFREGTVGRDKGESRRNKHRKIEGKGDKRGWSSINRSWSVCLSDCALSLQSVLCSYQILLPNTVCVGALSVLTVYVWVPVIFKVD